MGARRGMHEALPCDPSGRMTHMSADFPGLGSPGEVDTISFPSATSRA